MAADINEIIERNGELLHGNPFREPRVVLSRELLESGKIKPPTRIELGRLTDVSLRRAGEFSTKAWRENVPLIPLLFCHGNKEAQHAQGPDFERPSKHLAAAIVEANLDSAFRGRLIEDILVFVQEVKQFENARVAANTMQRPQQAKDAMKGKRVVVVSSTGTNTPYMLREKVTTPRLEIKLSCVHPLASIGHLASNSIDSDSGSECVQLAVNGVTEGERLAVVVNLAFVRE
ncbi:hypothetical protein GGS21DRAFT_488270 [Xylaria nigripes]|nr:hypothetical protein GGS21DRAFT_488270 [Xylaria nigripes]